MKNLKKGIIIAVSLIMAFSIVSCGNKNNEKSKYEDTEALLTAIYENIDENERMPVSGGDSDALNEEGPGRFNIEKKDELEIVTGLPEDIAESLTDAATMVNLMNANFFTAGAYKLENMDEASEGLVKNIETRKWLCGGPEILVILKSDGYLISAFGHSEMIDAFVSSAENLIEDTEVIVNQQLDANF